VTFQQRRQVCRSARRSCLVRQQRQLVVDPLIMELTSELSDTGWPRSTADCWPDVLKWIIFVCAACLFCGQMFFLLPLYSVRALKGLLSDSYKRYDFTTVYCNWVLVNVCSASLTSWCVCCAQFVLVAIRHTPVVILRDGNGPRPGTATLAGLDEWRWLRQHGIVGVDSRQRTAINHSQTGASKGKIQTSHSLLYNAV